MSAGIRKREDRPAIVGGIAGLLIALHLAPCAGHSAITRHAALAAAPDLTPVPALESLSP